MTREEKSNVIEKLAERINETNHFYLTDISNLNAVNTSNLRRLCFKKDIKLLVVKNTLLKKAIQSSNKNNDDLVKVLENGTSIMFCNTNSAPAKLIKEFRRNHEKPILKAAYVEECVYIGDNQLDNLANIKSKDELVGDIVMLLQSPVKKVISQLQSGKHIIGGIVKTLSEKE
jgi:large subunit ribosomal protein L10